MQVIEGKYEKLKKIREKKKSRINKLYKELYYREMFYTDEFDAKKAVFYGVKYAIRTIINTESTEKEVLQFLTDLSDIAAIMSNLTYREMIQIFPIGKDFDGWKYEAKDYWSTKEWLERIDLDSKLGDNVDNFLWFYYNIDIMNFGIKRTLMADKVMKFQTGRGIMEGFLDVIDPKHEIHTYRINREKGYIYDMQTGKTSKLIEPKRKIPPYMRVIKNE